MVTEPVAILALAAAVGAASQAIFVVQSPFLMEHSRPEHRSELFSLQYALLPVTNVGAALLGGAIAAVVGSVAGIGTSDPAVYQVLLLRHGLTAAAATVTVLALRDDRPRRRRDWRTLEQRPATRGSASRSPSAPDRGPCGPRRGSASRIRPTRGRSGASSSRASSSPWAPAR